MVDMISIGLGIHGYSKFTPIVVSAIKAHPP